MPIKESFFEDLARNEERFDITAAIRRLEVPVLVLQSEGDSEKILNGARKLMEAAPHQTHVTIDGADHTFNAGHPFNETNIYLEQAIEHSDLFLRDIVL